MDRVPQVCVVGLGHVGLPTAALLARAGRRVVGVDVDEARRADIVAGRIGPEPGLGELVGQVLGSALTLAARPVPAPAYVACVPTPVCEGRADLGALDAAVSSVAAVAPRGALLLVESTVPVGTTDALSARFSDLHVAICPERVLPGDALREITGNDRVVGGSPEAVQAACELLAAYVHGDLLRTDTKTAELCKLVENAARDVELALANTVAEVARTHGLDPWRVRELVNRHPRVALLEPGIGVGGHCLPVDPWFVLEGAEAPLLRAAREVNDAVPHAVVDRLRAAVPPGATVALLGLAYKPDVADARHAPALAIARALQAEYDVVVTDPYVPVPDDLRGVSLEEALTRDVVVLLVAHTVYQGVRVDLDLCRGPR